MWQIDKSTILKNVLNNIRENKYNFNLNIRIWQLIIYFDFILINN